MDLQVVPRDVGPKGSMKFTAGCGESGTRACRLRLGSQRRTQSGRQQKQGFVLRHNQLSFPRSGCKRSVSHFALQGQAQRQIT